MQASSSIETDAAPTGRAASPGSLILALAGAIGSLALSFATGANKLVESGGEGDSLMRLVQVRDLMAGQDWFDLTQYRMGPAGGFEMHWSRLVDAPITVLIWLAELVTGDSGLAETIAAWLWPGLLLAICLAFLMRSARNLGGSEAVFPAAILGLAALHFMGIFAPGSFDHHNLQLALILGAVTALTSPAGFRAGLAAGAGAAASLAVGMETAPMVAALGAVVALVFLVRGEAERPLAAGFGVAFAGVVLPVSLATLPAARWFAFACDAWSGAQAGTALIAGVGLTAIAATPQLAKTAARRLVGLSALAIVTAAYSASMFPACFADPYAGLDPLLRQYWLDWVTEAQGALSLMSNRPGEAAGYFVTPLLALAFLSWLALGKRNLRSAFVIGLPLAAALAVSFWQVRGAMFSVPLAIIPLAAMVARARTAAARGSGLAPTVILALAWLASFNIAWNMGVTRVASILSLEPARVNGVGAASTRQCYGASDYADLAKLDPAAVLAISNLGAPILFNTGHRVMSGPYHRNVEGNLAALRALTSEPDAARTIIEDFGIKMLVHCPGNSETKVLSAKFPESLLAGLARDDVPGWLVSASGSGAGALRIFHVEGR